MNRLEKASIPRPASQARLSQTGNGCVTAACYNRTTRIHPDTAAPTNVETAMTTQTLTRTQTDTQQHTPKKRLFTRKEYHSMGKAGIFAPNERVELLEGEIIVMSPAGDRHSACIVRLNRAFAGLNIANRTLVSVQSPVVTSPTSEPEPDLMLLSFRDDRYDFGKPRPQDVLLLIEVSDSSLEYDREVKLPYYASPRNTRNMDSQLTRRPNRNAHGTCPTRLPRDTHLQPRRHHIAHRVPRP